MKKCRWCNKEVNNRKRYCNDTCRNKYRYKNVNYKWHLNYRKAKGQTIGVGSGGLTESGENNPAYTTGIGLILNRYNRLMKRSIRYCECCRVDLKYATRYQWCCHHRDHDRANNDKSNLQLLCKSCHQKHHKVWNNFKSATTIREE